MAHFLQEKRKRNLQKVKNLLARAMPQGLKEGIFQALLSREYGFSRHAINDYLSILLDTSEIEFENLSWKLVIIPNPGAGEKKGKEG